MAEKNGTFTRALWLHCKDYLDVYPEVCKYDESYYEYRIWIVPNALFLGLFALSFIGYVGVFGLTRFRNVGFTVALLLGVLCEALGYLGRVLSWQDQWSENGFLIQICCLTIGPAFVAAGIYFCLRNIVVAFGAENSRINPALYPRIVSLSQLVVAGGDHSTNCHLYSSFRVMLFLSSCKLPAVVWHRLPATMGPTFRRATTS